MAVSPRQVSLMATDNDGGAAWRFCVTPYIPIRLFAEATNQHSPAMPVTKHKGDLTWA